MYTSIVVGTDGSDTAAIAVSQALELAKLGGATLHIVHAYRTVGADLVVVGNRGMTGVKRFVLGNVPNKISHDAPCSVLIVDTSREDVDRRR